MAYTEIRGEQILDSDVERVDLRVYATANEPTTLASVVRRVVAGNQVNLTSYIDSGAVTKVASTTGTGDVIVAVSTTPTFISLTLDVANGITPMTITSSTLVANLNADMVDGLHSISLAKNTEWGEPTSVYYNGTSAGTGVPYANQNGNLDFGTGDFSISIYLKINSLPTGTKWLLSKGAGVGTVGYAITLTATGVVSFRIETGTGSTIASTTLSVGQWYHLVGTFDRDGNLIVYTNGVAGTPVGLSSRTDSITNNYVFGIGGYLGASDFGNISVNTTRLYNTTLTQSEITSLYNNGRPDLAEVPYQYKWGSQTSLITTPYFSGGTTLSNITATGYTHDYASGNQDVAQIYNAYVLNGVKGKSYRVTFNCTINSGSITGTFRISGMGSSGQNIVAGVNTYLMPNSNAANGMYISIGSTTAVNYTISNYLVVEVGCVAEYKADNSTSATWYDNSINGLNGTHTAVSLSNPNGFKTDYLNVNTAASAVLTTSVTSPLFIGGTAVGSNILYRSTTGTGTTTGIAHQWLGGTNGGTVIATMLNNGNMGIGIVSSNGILHLYKATGAAQLTITANDGTNDALINFERNNDEWCIGLDTSASNAFKISHNSVLGANDHLIVSVWGTVGIGYDASAITDAGKLIVRGNVGIGNNTPGKKLDITGDARVSSQFISTLADGGIQPIDVTSKVKCTNLNADAIDGVHIGNISDGQLAIYDDAQPSLKGISLGTTAGTVAKGDHLHSGVYSVVAHNHSTLYEPLIFDLETSSKATGYLTYNNGTSLWDFKNETYSVVAHTHTGVYDNYDCWTIWVDGHEKGNIETTNKLDFIAGTGISLDYSAGHSLTIDATHNHDTAYLKLLGETTQTVEGHIVNSDAPTDGTHLVNRDYVDGAVSTGFQIKEAVTYASVVNIDIFQTYIPTGTPNLSIDGETNLDYNCRILLKDQASAEENGIYDFWDIGGGEFQFTRASDSNTKEEIFGSLVFVTLGTTNGKTSWANGNTDIDNFTLDDDNIVYYQFTGQTTYVAGDGLTLTGTTLDINLTNKLLFTGNAIDLPQAIDVASTPVFNGIDLMGQLGTTYTGAAPFHLQSASANFINTYLNADLLDGQHGSYYQPADADLTAIAALGYTATSFLKKTAANTWALDTNIYMTSNFFGVYSSNITLAAAANPFQGALACVINDDPILDLYVYVDYGDTFYWRKVSTLTNIPNI